MEQAVMLCLSRPRHTHSVERTCWEETASPQPAEVHGTGLGHVHNELNQIVQRAVGALDGSTCARARAVCKEALNPKAREFIFPAAGASSLILRAAMSACT